jgi:hypothetical protein
MFCPKCGTENPDRGKFCRQCGTDLGNVSSALSGDLRPLQTPPVLLSRKGKPVNWESAIVKIFSGLAFIGVTIALSVSQMGRGWWFWMLIPAFSALGSGVAQLVQLKKHESQNMLIQPNHTERQIPIMQQSSLPPSQNDYIKPQKSIYDTGELVIQPSVTENTTRHLEIDKEGETISLPKLK